MTTGLKQTLFDPRQLVTTADLKDRLLDFLLAKLRLQAELTSRGSGILVGGVLSSSAIDTFSIDDPTEGMAVSGRNADHFKLTGSLSGPVQFENTVAVTYNVGIKFQSVPDGVELNPRTGLPHYVSKRDTIGELGEPDLVVDNGANVTLTVNSVTEPNVDHSGRTVRVFLVDPKTAAPAAAFEDLVIVYDGTDNKVTTTTILGQIAASTTNADYTVHVEGMTWKRNTDLSADAAYAFLGTVEGVGLGSSPTVFDVTGQVNPSPQFVRYRDIEGSDEDFEDALLAAETANPSAGNRFVLESDVSALTLPFTQITGTLSDAQHADRAGGTLHALATQSVHGFHSSTDKTAHDALITGAVQALRKDGSVALTGTQVGVDPTASNHLSTRAYVDQEVAVVSGHHAAGVQTAQNLRDIAVVDREDKQLRLVEDKGANYRFDATGVGADDGDFTLVPTAGTGRWFKAQAATQDHEGLTGLLGGGASDHYHITNVQHSGLVGAGDTALHFHASDRALANATGTLSDAQHGTRAGALHATATTGVTGMGLLGNANPPVIGDGGAIGTQDGRWANANHTHGHGNVFGGTNHTVAVAGGSNGFLSGVDKAFIDNFVAAGFKIVDAKKSFTEVLRSAVGTTALPSTAIVVAANTLAEKLLIRAAHTTYAEAAGTVIGSCDIKVTGTFAGVPGTTKTGDQIMGPYTQARVSTGNNPGGCLIIAAGAGVDWSSGSADVFLEHNPGGGFDFTASMTVDWDVLEHVLTSSGTAIASSNRTLIVGGI